MYMAFTRAFIQWQKKGLASEAMCARFMNDRCNLFQDVGDLNGDLGQCQLLEDRWQEHVNTDLSEYEWRTAKELYAKYDKEDVPGLIRDRIAEYNFMAHPDFPSNPKYTLFLVFGSRKVSQGQSSGRRATLRTKMGVTPEAAKATPYISLC